MSDIQIGDRVSVSGGRNEIGVVLEIWGAYASVNFLDGPQHVQVSQLSSKNVRDRREREVQDKEVQRRISELALEEGRQKAAQKLEAKRQKAALRRAALETLRGAMGQDFLGVDALYQTNFSSILSRTYFNTEKSSFAQDWITRSLEHEGVNAKSPDSEQAEAIASVHGNVQVVARAGSGKTTTLVNRTMFLLKHCRVSPNEMLLLAFNRKAASEIRKSLLLRLVPEAKVEIENAVAKARAFGARIVPAEGEADAVSAIAERFRYRLPHVMTFHALAVAIVPRQGNILLDGPDDDSKALSQVVQEVIDEFMQQPDSLTRIRDLMMDHFREDWDAIVAGGFNLGMDDLLALKRSFPRETLAGELVKSRGEKAIADFLFEHDINYKYERNHWWSGANYRPDFTVFKTDKSGAIVEYFGMVGSEKYDCLTEKKKQYWAEKPHWSLISLYPHDLAPQNAGLFEAKLTHELKCLGIVCKRLSEEEIWQRIKMRSISRFTRAATSFIGRCRKKSWSIDDLAAHVVAHNALTNVESRFVALGSDVFKAYLDRLVKIGDDDFDGLMQRAAKTIASGSTTFLQKGGGGDIKTLKFVCIDEFQDFSELFHRLVDAMRKVNNRLEFFCVGDDWQAINGFAGSELRFFMNFQEYFEAPNRLYIATNYRSARQIVEVGNELMRGLGTPARADRKVQGDVWVSEMGGFKPTLIEKQRHPGDLITPMVVRLSNRLVSDGKKVVLLSRRNSIPWYFNVSHDDSSGRSLDGFLRGVRSCLPKGLRNMVSISTAHKYKGLERHVVIVLDAVARSYPLIHPDWSFARIFGDTPTSIATDERRLFYVALTRAVDSLVIITDADTQSPFLKEVRSRRSLSPLPWKLFPPVAKGSNHRLLLRVKDAAIKKYGSISGTFPIKDHLQSCRYQFNGVEKLWEKSITLENFDLESIKTEPWVGAAAEVIALFYDETETLLASYKIESGQWAVVTDRWDLIQQLKTEQGDVNIADLEDESITGN